MNESEGKGDLWIDLRRSSKGVHGYLLNLSTTNSIDLLGLVHLIPVNPTLIRGCGLLSV